MRFRHVLGLGGVRTRSLGAHMHGDALTALEEFYCSFREAHIKLLPQQ
jgi:hypothetical protein